MKKRRLFLQIMLMYICCDMSANVLVILSFQSISSKVGKQTLVTPIAGDYCRNT